MLKQKLLIVDDQPELRKMLRIALSYGKYQIFEAANGVSALEVVAAERPDVVLLDVMMPGALDGLAVCSSIKQNPATAACFVMLLTARGQTADFVEGDDAGADAYMVKPFSPARLIEVVEMREKLTTPVRAYGY